MRAAADTKDKAHAASLRRKCKELIARAEVLKRSLSTARPRGHAIIYGASRLHGNEFPPWESDPSREEFRLKAGSPAYRYVLIQKTEPLSTKPRLTHWTETMPCSHFRWHKKPY